MSLVLRLPRKIHLGRSSSNVPRLLSFLDMLQNPHVLLTSDKVHNPVRLPRKTTSERPKVLRTPSVFPLLTSKCASHHNGVHFFNISTSKSGPEPVCFVPFDFEICFAPQRPALFRHRNFCKCSEHVVLLTFDFEMRFAPQWRALFDISTSKSGPSMVCFVHFDLEMCFAPQRRDFSTLRSHKSLEKHSVSRLSYLFAHLDLLSSETFSFLIFFLLLCSSLTLPISAFHLSILSEV